MALRVVLELLLVPLVVLHSARCDVAEGEAGSAKLASDAPWRTASGAAADAGAQECQPSAVDIAEAAAQPQQSVSACWS